MSGPEHVIEFPHGYTYSGHPLACAASLATLDTYAEEGLLSRAKTMEKVLEDGLHSLRGAPHVIDLRNLGLVGAIELAPRAGEPGKRGFEVLLGCWEKGVLIRTTGDTIALSPPLIVELKHIEQMVSVLADVLKTIE
jgi:beta-alanine--pyruvate transaminase